MSDVTGHRPTGQQRDSLLVVVGDLINERHQQDARWGEQNHEDGTGGSVWLHLCQEQRARTDLLAKAGGVRWCDILLEEVYEALAESDVERLRAELVQVMAVSGAWIEALDRRAAQS